MSLVGDVGTQLEAGLTTTVQCLPNLKHNNEHLFNCDRELEYITFHVEYDIDCGLTFRTFAQVAGWLSRRK